MPRTHESKRAANDIVTHVIENRFNPHLAQAQTLKEQLVVATQQGSLAAPALLALAAERDGMAGNLRNVVDQDQYYSYLFMAFTNARWLCKNENFREENLISEEDKEYGTEALKRYAKIARSGHVEAALVSNFGRFGRAGFFDAALTAEGQRAPTIGVNIPNAIAALEMMDKISPGGLFALGGLSVFYRGEYGDEYRDIAALQRIQDRLTGDLRIGDRINITGTRRDLFETNQQALDEAAAYPCPWPCAIL